MQLFGDNMPYFFSVVILYEMHTFDLWPEIENSRLASTLVMFVIVQGTYLAWMPSINKNMPSKVILGVMAGRL